MVVLLFGICSSCVRYSFAVVPEEGLVAAMSESQRRLVWLRLTLREFSTSPQFKTLDDRIRLQKLVYLAQEATGASEYSFSSYIRGPYSPALTRDLYGLRQHGQLDELEETAARYRLSDSAKDRLNQAIGVADDVLGPERVRWLELVASMHQKYAESGGGFDQVWEIVQDWKRGIFSESEARDAWTSLERHGLVTS